jgi:hypothetical protein
MVFPNLATGAGDGTFKMTFIDGDTLFGTLHYQGDFSSPPIVPFTQLLTVTGGTGALLLYHGTLIGIEISNQSDGTFTSSGGGTQVGYSSIATIGLRPPPDHVGRRKGCNVRIARHSGTISRDAADRLQRTHFRVQPTFHPALSGFLSAAG